MLFQSVLCFAEDGAEQCYKHLFAMPDLIPIANKMNIPEIITASFEQLANTDKATDIEKPLISKYAEGIKVCWDLEISLDPQPRHPKAKKRDEDFASSRLKSLVDLYNQKISYGEYIKFRQEATLKANREWEELEQEIAEQDQIQNANNARINAMEEAQRRKALSDAFGNMGDAIRNSRPPRAINCNPNGYGGVRCQ